MLPQKRESRKIRGDVAVRAASLFGSLLSSRESHSAVRRFHPIRPRNWASGEEKTRLAPRRYITPPLSGDVGARERRRRVRLFSPFRTPQAGETPTSLLYGGKDRYGYPHRGASPAHVSLYGLRGNNAAGWLFRYRGRFQGVGFFPSKAKL